MKDSAEKKIPAAADEQKSEETILRGARAVSLQGNGDPANTAGQVTVNADEHKTVDADVVVALNADSEDENYAAQVKVDGPDKNKTASLTVNGSISLTYVSANYRPSGIKVSANIGGATASAHVTGDVFISGEAGETPASGIIIEAMPDHGHSRIQVDGSVKAKGTNALGIHAVTEEQGDTIISVGEDVVSEGTGLQANCNNGMSDSVHDILIGGTLYGEKEAIELAGEASATHTTLTAWEVKTGENGTLITGDDTGTFAKAINYIVKLADGLNNKDVSTANHKTVTYNVNFL